MEQAGLVVLSDESQSPILMEATEEKDNTPRSRNGAHSTDNSTGDSESSSDTGSYLFHYYYFVIIYISMQLYF